MIEQEYIQSKLVQLAKRLGLIIEAKSSDVIKEKNLIATGDLRKSIKSEIENRVWQTEITIYSDLPYSYVVHEGRKSGTMPPIMAIRDWIHVKRIIPRPKASKNIKRVMSAYWAQTQLAWAIAKSIKAKGTKGVKFFDIAMSQAMSDIEKEISRFSL